MRQNTTRRLDTEGMDNVGYCLIQPHSNLISIFEPDQLAEPTSRYVFSTIFTIAQLHEIAEKKQHRTKWSFPGHHRVVAIKISISYINTEQNTSQNKSKFHTPTKSPEDIALIPMAYCSLNPLS